MKAMYRCHGCRAVFEADADPWSDPEQAETMLSKCPECGRSGSAGSWRQYPEGCMRVVQDRDGRIGVDIGRKRWPGSGFEQAEQA